MIKLDNIKKVFQTEDVETWALRNISLEVKEGEFVAIMGPSGCGKSTLLNIIGLLNNPSGGSYLLDGRDVSTLKESERTLIRRGMIGFVFQSFNLIDELNVAENIELPLLYMGVSSKERRKRSGDVMERVGMSHRAKHYPSQLSGGQQQRTAIARAILPRPKLVLADEPTGNLDPETASNIVSLLKDITKQGTAVVMTTHNIPMLDKFPGIVYRCKEGVLYDVTNEYNHIDLTEDGEDN